MKKLIVISLIILVFSLNAFAKLAVIELDEAIKNNDLIIVGTLTNVLEKKGELGTKGTGEIIVDKFIAGNVKTTDGFTLKSGDKLRLNYLEDFACIMGSHRRIENEKGVFLLTFNDAGEILSKDFRLLEDLEKVKKLLKKGVQPNNTFKTVKTQNDAEQELAIQENKDPKKPNSKVSFGLYTLERKINYQPLLTLLTILGSISLYYFLYRSRFKIR